MLTRILTAAHDNLLREERRTLTGLRSALARLGAAADQQEVLDRSIEQLDDLFLLVVVGEFNAGKSAFINALLGSRILQEGVTPTTAHITVLKHGEAVQQDDRRIPHTIQAPVPLLREIHIVDTPGTNAIIREHEAITAEFVPRSDLVLFVTSADRPFTETERGFMERIRAWGKKVVIVVNKVDILDSAREVEEVRTFVADAAQALLKAKPEIFFVSAKLALRAKQGEPALWAASGFEVLERYIAETLDQEARIRLKLLNPLGVASAVTGRQLSSVRERLGLLKDDFQTLEEVDQQIALYERDMHRDFELRMAELEKILLELEHRGHAYFDDTLRIGRFMDLLNRSRIQEGFERQVVAAAPQLVERRVAELIDWLVDADLQQWQAVTAHLADRRRKYAGRIVGDTEAGRFHHDRRRLIDSVGRAAQQVVETYDRGREARELADSARNAVATAAAVSAGALGLGTIVTVAASTAAADVTGLLMASLLGAIGFFIIPAKRKKAKDELKEKITGVRSRLIGALREQFAKEIGRSAGRVRESIAPYSRFIRAEGDKLSEAEQELSTIHTEIESLRGRVERLAA